MKIISTHQKTSCDRKINETLYLINSDDAEKAIERLKDYYLKRNPESDLSGRYFEEVIPEFTKCGSSRQTYSRVVILG